MKAYELISSPFKWTKGCFARDRHGAAISEYSDDATCFCLVGAIHKCYEDDTDGEYNALMQLEGALNVDSLPRWNDEPERTHEEIVGVLKKFDI
jgi:hypothetical protein